MSSKFITLDAYTKKQLKNPEFKKEYKKLEKKYLATVTFIDGSTKEMGVISHNKESAKLRIKLMRQKIGDEMFIRSIKIKLVKE